MGLIVINHFLITHREIIKILGGAFLLYLACYQVRSKPSITNVTTVRNKMAGWIIAKAALHILANPMTIL